MEAARRGVCLLEEWIDWQWRWRLCDAGEQLHDARKCADEMRDTVRDKEESLAIRGIEEELRREAASTLRRVQGLEVHAQVSMTKFDQRLASLPVDADTAKVYWPQDEAVESESPFHPDRNSTRVCLDCCIECIVAM